MLFRSTTRALLYTEMVTAPAVIHGDRERLLGFDAVEHPVALQLGGSDPAQLAEAARIGEDYGYDEINLNVGCPSDRVQGGHFGACLMAEPDLVARGIEAMRKAVRVPVTVKCRIGIDDQDSEADFERFITIGRSKGSGNVDAFIRNIRSMMDRGDMDGAKAACAKQKGSVANVVNAGLDAYRTLQNDQSMDKERKMAALQKELEEATTLELPMLSKNLVIISTIASIATLLGLFGTVLGMIRAFAALATAGAPDAVALSTGISEALINTALGIGTSALAIIMYNYRSEEHTSELQSPYVISYAVFCLKKNRRAHV